MEITNKYKINSQLIDQLKYWYFAIIKQKYL